MSANFPTGLDAFTTPSSSATLGGSSPTHTGLHTNEGDAIEALEAKVGVDSSAVTTSLDYRVNSLESRVPTNSTGWIVLSTTNTSTAGTALNAAIAALPTNGGTILVPGGTWTIDTAVLINKSGVIIRGVGPIETLLRFNGSTIATAIKMADTTQRVFAIADLRIDSSVIDNGTAIDASYFTNSIFSNLRIGSSTNSPNKGIIFNAIGSYYNVIRDCRIAVSGSGSVAVSFDNISNSNVVENTRIIGDAANTIGVYVNAHSIQLNHVDIEQNCAVAIDVATSGNDCTILAPYLDTVTGIGVRVASAVESCTILGGFIADSGTADIQDNGADSLAVINTRVAFAARNTWSGTGVTLGAGGTTTAGGERINLVQGDDTHIGLFGQANSGSALDMIQLKDSGGNLRFQVNSAGNMVSRATSFFTTNIQMGATSADVGGGSGVISVKQAGTAPTTNPTAGNIVYVNTNSHLAVRRPSGSLIVVGGRVASTTSTTTIANTTTLTALQAYTVPANDVVVGQEYEFTGYGVFSTTLTPTITLALYYGGVAGTQIAAIPAITGPATITNSPFRYRANVIFRSTTSCVAMLELDLDTSVTTDLASSYISTPSAVTSGLTTTADADLTVGFTWGTADASNTISLLGGDVRAVV